MRIKKTAKILQKQQGISLVETIFLIIILAISLPAISRLLQRNIESSVEMNGLNKATFYAQSRLEQIVADYANTAETGNVVFDEITTDAYEAETFEAGYTTTVAVMLDSLNSVKYKEITVMCTNPQGPSVSLQTWIANI
ncbi:hypothetical protein JW835_07355 [bacterium]|nr:hypothetical protein [bacterium]